MSFKSRIILLPLMITLIGLSTVAVVRAAAGDIGTSRTGAQSVKTFSSTFTYSDIKAAPGAVGNDSTFKLTTLPANSLITSVFVNVPTAFYVNNDPSSNVGALVQILDAKGALNAVSSTLNSVGTTNNYGNSTGLADPFNDPATVQIQFHANDSANTGGIQQLTSGKATVYVTYMPYKTY